MIRGFQILPQNSNKIAFDPFWQKNYRNLAKIPGLANFQQVFGRKNRSDVIRFEFRGSSLEYFNHLALIRI